MKTTKQEKSKPKNILKEPWANTKITLYRAPSSLSEFTVADAVQELDAKKAVYEVPEIFLRGDYYPEEFITFADPKSGHVYLGRPSPVFIETKSGIFGVRLVDFCIWWERSCVDATVKSGGVAEAISRFEGRYDTEKRLEEEIAEDTKLLKDDGSAILSRTELESTLGADFFRGGSSGPSEQARILQMTISGKVLQLDLESSIRPSKANVWVDVETRRVVRALRDGKPPPAPWPTELPR